MKNKRREKGRKGKKEDAKRKEEKRSWRKSTKDIKRSKILQLIDAT